MPYGYTQPSGWRALRNRILMRDAHACYICGAPATEVDHLVAVSQGGTHDDDNLGAICQPHHLAKSKAERLAGVLRARQRKREAHTEPHPGAVRRP